MDPSSAFSHDAEGRERLARFDWTHVTPQDVWSVISSARLVFILSSVNALVFAAIALQSESLMLVSCWYAATQVLFAWVYLRSRAALKRGFTRPTVSPRAIRRMVLMGTLQAAPWAFVAIVFLGQGSAQLDMVVPIVCAGMSIAGAVWSHRVVPASLAYCFTILTAAIIGALHHDAIAYWPIIAYSASLSVLIVFIVANATRAVRQRDAMVEEVSAKNLELGHAQARIMRLACEDPLTGLPNRKALTDRLEEEIAASANRNRRFALLILDVDRFKNVNDTHGHQVGDRLLKAVADCLKSTVRRGDFVARLGGDEFAVLLYGVREDAGAETLAQSIRARLARAFEFSGLVLHSDSSVGVAVFPDDGRTAAELLVSADIALHRAKDEGKGRVAVYSAAMASAVAEADAMERDLRSALDQGGLEMRYQPKVDLETRRIIGAEALLRWPRAGGFVPPPVFLQVAEERGLILDVSAFVFRQVAADLKRLRPHAAAPLPIAINIHPADLKNAHALFARLRDLEEAGVSPSEVLFEITEGCVVGRGSDKATETLARLKERGVRLSLDDFGTGHASLSHLKFLPVDELKIDREFVSGVTRNTADRAIVSSAIALSGVMGLSCVAEGVETEAQLDALKALGCSVAQGYLFAPAIPMDAFIALIDAQEDSREESQEDASNTVQDAGAA